MQQIRLYPMLLEPVLHVKVWGGRRLETVLHKTLPTAEPYGESWEMHDTVRVANGALRDRTLGDLLSVYGADLIGEVSDPKDGLPLLVKLIDATDWLSVQVHPDDEQARRLEGDPRGKTEAWYIIAAEPNSRLVIGVDPRARRDEIADAVRANRLEDLLVYASVAPGNVLYVAAGTIHALGPGVLVYEIQQSSDITYRFYDWGRMGLDGSPRPLHIDKALEVARLGRLPVIRYIGGERDEQVNVVESPFFRTMLHQLRGEAVELDTGGRVFHALTCIHGEAQVFSDGEPVLTLATGQTAFIPAAVGGYRLTGTARVLRSYQNA